MPKWTNRDIASKDEADQALNELRTAIRGGDFDPRGKHVVTADIRLTFGDVADRYLEAFPLDKDKRYYLGYARRIEVPAAHGKSVLLEAKAIDAVTTADVEHVAAVWRDRPDRRTDCAKGGAVAVRKLLQTMRHLFNWSIKKGHTTRTPFRREGVAVIEVKASSGRSRRLADDEDARLLAAADPYTRDVIIAALETGCRGGELRSLQWSNVRNREIVIEPEKAKTRRARAIPITQRLRAVFEMRKHAPDGTEHPAAAYVFGNAVGEPVTAERANELWRATCKAAGIADLHFHDLRREFACRLMESGASAHETRDALGHANLTMTNQYLSTSGIGLARAFDRFERARIAEADATFKNVSSHTGEPADVIDRPRA